MRYQVPQFIEMEDKIIGPFTLRQFLYLISVPAVCYILHFFVRLPYVILVGIIFFPIAVLLAFFKINGRSFVYAVGGFLRFVRRPQIYVWRRIPVSSTQEAKKGTAENKNQAHIPKKGVDDFKKLAEILDSQRQSE